MTNYQPFYIANYEENGGLDKYFESFLIPEKAFTVLEDAYAYKGKIKRRDGYTNLERLRRVFSKADLGLTGASVWNFNIYAQLVVPITGEPNAEIQPGSVVLIIIPFPTIMFGDDGAGNLTSATPGNSGTINYATGDVSLTHTGGAGAAVWLSFAYYPTLPVMGLPRQETDVINEEDLIAFDTKYAYHYTAGQFEQLGTAAWHGTDYNFFWSTNYFQNVNGKLSWTTNFHRGATNDPIRYWDTNAWTDFAPIIRADSLATPTKLLQARIIVPYKGHLLAFNTYEGDNAAIVTQYPQRVRWCQSGTPLTIGTVVAGPTWGVVGAWADDRVGYGGYLDAPIEEQIVSVAFIKDVLIVKFERSSWKIVYTGIKIDPFHFEKINTELGCESTFSAISFDRGIFTVGNYGITTDDSVNVFRIDIRVPDVILDINNSENGVYRVHGIRDFTKQLCYWTYPKFQEDQKFPNRMLVYNYINQTFSIFKDSYTCFGYYQRSNDVTWAELPYLSWSAWNKAWNTGITQSQYPTLAAGNQQGFVSLMNQQSFNDVFLSIKAINTAFAPNRFTIPDHNLEVGGFVKISSIIATGAPSLTVLNGNIYKIETVVDGNTVELTDSTGANVSIGAGATYLGGGKITPLNNLRLRTKQFAPLYNEGSAVRLGYVDYLIDRTANGEMTADIYVNENYSESVTNPDTSIGMLGTNVIYTRPEDTTLIPYQANQDKIWHRQFAMTSMQNYSVEITLNDDQMFDESINASDFVLHAMTFYLSKNGRLVK